MMTGCRSAIGNALCVAGAERHTLIVLREWLVLCFLALFVMPVCAGDPHPPQLNVTFVAQPAPVLQDGSGKKLATRANPLRRAARGETFTQEFTIHGPDGQQRWFEANGRPVQPHRAPAAQGGVVVIRDVTDRSLRQLQDQFVTVASHELRNPLTALRGSLEMLLRSLPPEPGNSRAGQYASLGLEQSQLDR